MIRIFFIRFLLLWIFIILVGGCAGSLNGNGSFSESRQSIARALEDNGNYADALNQWKILQVVYPDNKNISSQIVRISKMIKQKTDILQTQLEKLQHGGKNSQKRILNLKILALDPGNIRARKAMSNIESKIAYIAANDKNTNNTKYFHEMQKKAHKSILSGKFVNQVNNLIALGKTKKILKVVSKFLTQYPKDKVAIKYRYDALILLGDNNITANNIEEAVAYYDQALLIADGDTGTLELRSIKLKKQLSQEYYKKGIAILKNDINKAIELMKTSISYDAENKKAHQQLQRAKRIQNKLKQISNQG